MKIRDCLFALAVVCVGAPHAMASGGGSGTEPAENTSPATTALGQVASNTAQAASGTAAADGASSGGEGFIAVEDDPLIVDATAIVDADGMGAVSVQWQISEKGKNWENLSGARQQSFTPREVHVGKRLRVVITYVDGQGNLETLTSPPSNPVQNVNDKPTGALLLTGIAREGDALIVDASTIDDEDGVGAYDIVWQRSSSKTDWQAFPEATSEILQLGQGHVGYAYRAVVTYIDSHDTREVVVSNPSETVTNVDDPVQGEVAISGEPVEGGSMTVDVSTISDEDGIASLSVSWESSEDGRNWRTVGRAATSSKLDLGQNLVGMQVRAKASVVDIFGAETLIYSQSSNTIRNVNNSPVGTINVRRLGS